MNRRAEAATRVRALHPPLTVLFAALRAEVGGAPAPDPLAVALQSAVEDGADDGDALALRLALAADEILGDTDASDALLLALAPYAAAPTVPPPADLLDRLRAVARNAGVLAAARASGHDAVQRFGEPWCPRSECFGRDGVPLTDERVRTDGVPPYGDGCNCRIEVATPS